MQMRSVEEQGSRQRRQSALVAVQQMQSAGADGCRDAQDYGLGDTLDAVALPVVGRVEQVVRRLLELRGDNNRENNIVFDLVCIEKWHDENLRQFLPISSDTLSV